MRAPGVDVETIVVIVLAGVSVGVGVLRILHALFDGENKAESEAGNEQEPMSSQRWTIVVLVALVLLLGIFPALIAPLAQATAAGFF
jgi:formate hydrogenlyase subunit 3/multisubunit Na+/H+ antiporter MnhD subunit